MSSKKTLIILTPGFPANENDSTCLPERQLFVKHLKSNFPLLNIIVLSFQYPHFAATYDWYEVEVHSFNGRNKGRLYRLLTWVKVWKTLNSIHKQNEVIGLLSFWLGEAAFIGKQYSKCSGIKHYCWLLGQDAKKVNKYKNITHLKSSEIIALSDFLAEEFYKNHGIRPQHVIPPGLDNSTIRKSIKQKRIDILGVGSLIALKQYDIFVDVVNAVQSAFPNIKVILCGNGPEKEKLIDLINKHHLQENIELMGEIPHQKVLQLMQQTKLLLHPSIYEGFSTVCHEALSAGAQVVSFCKPMNHSIDHWHIVSSKKNMINVVMQLLSQVELDHRSVSPFSIEKTVELTMQLFS